MKKDFYFHPNTELGIDLKLLTRKPGQLPVGETVEGLLNHDKAYQYTFRETLPLKDYPRNPRVYNGKFITITRKKDGGLQPNFKPIKDWKDFSATTYARGVANELLWGLSGLVEKEAAK